VRIATYNLKDYFAPTCAEDEPHFQRRTQHLAAEITRSEADVVMLQELGGAASLAHLCAELSKKNGDTFRGFAGDVDERGIGCGVLTRLPVKEHLIHRCEALPFPVFIEGDGPPFGAHLPLRRPFVEVTVEEPELGRVTVITGHLKSNLPRKLRTAVGEDVAATTSYARGEASVRAEVLRQAEALFLRQLADRYLAEHATALLVVGGDLNADLNSTPVRLLADERGPQPLFSARERVPEHRRYTMLHNGRPRLIDHLLLSTALEARLTGADIQNDTLQDHGARAVGLPRLVESDHALFWAEFSAAKPSSKDQDLLARAAPAVPAPAASAPAVPAPLEEPTPAASIAEPPRD
jgi:endonuclease/exonuclease/phosphatase family metal-dependent hydrolase